MLVGKEGSVDSRLDAFGNRKFPCFACWISNERGVYVIQHAIETTVVWIFRIDCDAGHAMAVRERPFFDRSDTGGDCVAGGEPPAEDGEERTRAEAQRWDWERVGTKVGAGRCCLLLLQLNTFSKTHGSEL